MSTTLTRSRGTVGSSRSDLQFVSFVIGDADYGVNVSDVYGIYHGLPLIPNSDWPSILEGEVQLADRRIPVVNLRRFAGLADTVETDSASWIVMVNDQRGPVGFVVDRVTEVVRLAERSLETPHDVGPCPVSDYLIAVARHRGRPMLLPDWNRLLHDATQ